MEANFKFQKEENKVFIFGIWDKTSVSKIKIKDLLSQICRRKNKMSQKKNKMSYFCDKLSFFQP